MVELIWLQGRIVQGYDPENIRQDAFGWWMSRGHYGQTTPYGWEIDHIIPVARNGTDHPLNLQPLQWSNNRKKGDYYPTSASLYGT
jgi:5-methylcytosine-specific restriction endonuclease McrA